MEYYESAKKTSLDMLLAVIHLHINELCHEVYVVGITSGGNHSDAR